jgi:phosphatidylglycerol:prolipoprotein diacylglycerol transferase
MQSRLFTLDFSAFGGDYTIPAPSYFVLLLIGFLFATIIGCIWAKRVGQDPDVIVDLGLAMLLAGVAGGRLLHVLADGYFWDYVHLCTDPSKVDWHVTRNECLTTYDGVWNAVQGVCRPKQADCLAWAKFYGGGFAYYGGFIGASAAAWFLLKADRFPFWKGADMAGMVVPVGLAFGRMGCTLAGCCFGKRWDSSWALSFPPHSPASEAQWKDKLLMQPSEASLPVHPTQLYEAFAGLLIAAFLMLYLHGRKRYDGQIFIAFTVLYALARFVIEIFRDDDRGALFGLSTSQLIGLILVAVGGYLHVRLSKAAAPPIAPPAAA